MEELELMVADLKTCLEEKEAEINRSISSVSSYVISSFNNRKIEVALFEKSTHKITKDPFEKNNIIANFTRDAEELKSQINKIEI